MWYRAGHVNYNAIYYANSTDGLNWTKYGYVYPAVVYASVIMLPNGSFEMYHSKGGNWNIWRTTSTNGLNWTTPQCIISPSVNGWDNFELYNSFVYYDFNTGMRHMLYEAKGNGSPYFQVGYAYSLDGVTWAKYAYNPVIPATSLYGISNPWLTKIDGEYYTVISKNRHSTTPYDDATYAAKSTDMIHWATSNKQIIPTDQQWETLHNGVGVADPCIIEAQGKTWFFYNGDQDSIGVAYSDSSLKEFVAYWF